MWTVYKNNGHLLDLSPRTASLRSHSFTTDTCFENIDHHVASSENAASLEELVEKKIITKSMATKMAKSGLISAICTKLSTMVDKMV